jgi:nitrate reductase gamma subunit
MKILYPFGVILVLVLLALSAGQAQGGPVFLGVASPYAAIAVFLVGFCYRVVRWARSPVPFRIPTTCGQQKSLPWIKAARFENPSGAGGVLVRMALEVLLFRSLFRNNRANLDHDRLIFGENKYLWLGALAFHWSLLMILLRHLRLLVQPVPAFVLALQQVDGFFQVGTPELYLSDVALIAALAYLLLRRLREPLVRYISQFTDYFALFLLLGIAISGVLMRYVTRVDVVAVKQFALGLASLHPVAPPTLSPVFLVHLLLVSTLAAYFPFSKLVHMGGVFISPTRNLANNNRSKRHVNPWNYPVKTHAYHEWEEEFRDKLLAAGIPLEAEDAERVTSN